MQVDITDEKFTAAPTHSVRRVIGKLCQLLARKMPLIPGKGRVFLQRLHGVNFVDWHSVIIGEDVVFDDLYPNAIQVGRRCNIGANLVLTKDVPPYAIMVGVPAKQIGTRPSMIYNNNGE